MVQEEANDGIVDAPELYCLYCDASVHANIVKPGDWRRLPCGTTMYFLPVSSHLLLS